MVQWPDPSPDQMPDPSPDDFLPLQRSVRMEFPTFGSHLICGWRYGTLQEPPDPSIPASIVSNADGISDHFSSQLADCRSQLVWARAVTFRSHVVLWVPPGKMWSQSGPVFSASPPRPSPPPQFFCTSQVPQSGRLAWNPRPSIRSHLPCPQTALLSPPLSWNDRRASKTRSESWPPQDGICLWGCHCRRSQRRDDSVDSSRSVCAFYNHGSAELHDCGVSSQLLLARRATDGSYRESRGR